MRKKILLLGVASMALGLLTVTGCHQDKIDRYRDGKLIVSARNLYFGAYAGGDRYLQEVEKQFGITFDFASYDWANWSTQVTGSINGQNMIIHPILMH